MRSLASFLGRLPIGWSTKVANADWEDHARAMRWEEHNRRVVEDRNRYSEQIRFFNELVRLNIDSKISTRPSAGRGLEGTLRSFQNQMDYFLGSIEHGGGLDGASFDQKYFLLEAASVLAMMAVDQYDWKEFPKDLEGMGEIGWDARYGEE